MSAIALTQINVWIDVVFTTLYSVVVTALAFHFFGNLISGRAYRRFSLWEWPHHEGPEIPWLPKFLHFQHVGCMILLGFSGMYIRFPFFNGGRTAMRYVHYVAMVVVTINLVWRLWYAFRARQRDYKEFAITRRDLETMPQVLMYYVFIKSSKPHLGKYNVMQKSTYIIFAPLLFAQALTGLALLTQPFIFGHSPRELLLGWWLGALVGSVDLAGWYARMVHYLLNWLFIVLTTIHVYLSMSEDLPAFLNFFGLSFLDRNKTAHGDGAGHEGPTSHVAPTFSAEAAFPAPEAGPPSPPAYHEAERSTQG